ncbi:group II intron maturase-specific domain-containing protein [Bradyrhizobium sp. RDI18]
MRTTLRQGRGRTPASTVKTLTPILRGWLQYFRLAEAKGGRGARRLDGA